jgi:hypothetical protein
MLSAASAACAPHTNQISTSTFIPGGIFTPPFPSPPQASAGDRYRGRENPATGLRMSSGTSWNSRGDGERESGGAGVGARHNIARFERGRCCNGEFELARASVQTIRNSKAASVGPLHGYFFGRLNDNTPPANGVSYVAYPAEYRVSGVMTFVVTPKDVVYERDLGPNTANVAASMTNWKPANWWRVSAALR